MVKEVKDTEKMYSKTLYKKMIVEKCGGDFCDYVMSEKVKMTTLLKKSKNGAKHADTVYFFFVFILI